MGLTHMQTTTTECDTGGISRPNGDTKDGYPNLYFRKGSWKK